jgi:hypothetical protein
MNRAHLLLIAALCVLAPGQAQPRGPGGYGFPLTKTPAVVVVTQHADARVVAHWNRVLAGIGSSFRLGQSPSGVAVRRPPSPARSSSCSPMACSFHMPIACRAGRVRW